MSEVSKSLSKILAKQALAESLSPENLKKMREAQKKYEEDAKRVAAETASRPHGW